MAFSTPEDVRDYPKQFAPIPASTETMDFFLNTDGIQRAARNSIVVAIITLILSTLLAIPAGYAIARYLFPGRDAIRLGILSVRAFPIVVLAVPLAITFIKWDMYDKVYSLALMHTALTLPTTILVVASVFAGVPYELEEAARIFGCTPAKAFWKVVLPLAMPGIAHRDFDLRAVMERSVCRDFADPDQSYPAAQILYTLDKSGDPFQICRWFFYAHPVADFHFFHPALSL